MTKEFGPKFNTVFLSSDVPKDERIKKLIFWGKKLSLFGLTPTYDYGAAGNLSFRTEDGFIITASGEDIGNLKEDDFVEVGSCSLDGKKVAVMGNREPSSESMFHCAIYGKRPAIKVIFHVHDEYTIRHCDELGLRCTENEEPAGSLELVNEILNALENLDYIVIKNHGIISLGAGFEEAGEKIIEVNSRIKR